MQTPASSAAVAPEMRELSASRQTWYVGQDAVSNRTYWVYTPVNYRAGTAVPVTYYKVGGMGHAWSGGTPGSIFTDPLGPDASEAMYEFFMAHPKEGE